MATDHSDRGSSTNVISSSQECLELCELDTIYGTSLNLFTVTHFHTIYHFFGVPSIVSSLLQLNSDQLPMESKMYLDSSS